jgi:hypothetical protein
MSSKKKIAANRINASKSCGPRTTSGKGRVSRNALRHGLAAMKNLDPVLPQDIELMAKAICADDTNPLLFEQALLIAECGMVLRCVRTERVGMIERLRDVTAIALAKGDNRIALAKAKMHEVNLAWAELIPLRAKISAMTKEERLKLLDEEERHESESASRRTPLEERDESDAMCEAMPDLIRLARYERRGWSRQKRALRRFIDIKSKKNEGG